MLDEIAEKGVNSSYSQTSVRVTDYYELESSVGQQVAALVNFPPKQTGEFMSEILVFGFSDDEGRVVMTQPTHKVSNGGRLF